MSSGSSFIGCANGFIEDIYGGGLIDNVSPWINVSADSTSRYASLMGMAKVCYDSLATVGCLLIIFFLFINIADRFRSEQITFETMGKVLVGFILVVALISHGYEIFSGIQSLTTEIGNQVISSFSTPPTKNDATVLSQAYSKYYGSDKITDAATAKSNGNIFSALSVITALMIPDFMQKMLGLYAQVIAISRGIQLCLYTALAPIGIADMFHGGLQSTGIRYLKKYFALCLQGPVMQLILGIPAMLSISSDSGGLDWGMRVLALFVVVKLLNSTSQIANDIAGA